MAIQAFTGGAIDPVTIMHLINLPENAVLLQHDAHHSFDALYSWGIEAMYDSDNKVSSVFHYIMVTITNLFISRCTILPGLLGKDTSLFG